MTWIHWLPKSQCFVLRRTSRALVRPAMCLGVTVVSLLDSGSLMARVGDHAHHCWHADGVRSGPSSYRCRWVTH